MAGLPDPDVIWREDGRAFSRRFGDVYFAADGVREIRHVFLDGIGAPDIWRGRDDVIIAETGFGSGLNFLSTWALWRETAAEAARLHYVAVEGYPMADEDMARAHTGSGMPEPLAAQLRRHLPPRVGGYHQRVFEGGRVRLTLLLGDAVAMLAGLEAQVDAWFLDGFAPAKNPDMWSPALIAEVARLSRPEARLATFTTIDRVRRDLAAAGFTMEKQPGIRDGTTALREGLAGRFTGDGARHDDSAPWFAAPKPPAPGSRVCVVGAGIAGCTAARALGGAGFAVTVLDAGPAPASGASGTPGAVVQPRPLIADDPNAIFHTAAYRRAVALYDALEASGLGIWRQRGLLVLGRDDEDAGRYRRLAESGILGDGAVTWLPPSAAGARAGLSLNMGGAWFPRVGSLETGPLCRALLDGIEIRSRAVVAGLRAGATGWRLIDAAGAILAEAETVVLAAGHASLDLADFAELGLHANRGQVTRIAGYPAIAGQRAPVSYGGYLLADHGGAIVGSTFKRIAAPADPAWRAPVPADDAANLELLAARLPGLAAPPAAADAGWVGLRATTTDRFPVLGPLPDIQAYAADYAALRHGPGAGPFPTATYRPGLYVFSGLGARGFLTAPLAADILAARLAGTPVPQPRSVCDALHPARFLIRRLKRAVTGVKIPKS